MTADDAVFQPVPGEADDSQNNDTRLLLELPI